MTIVTQEQVNEVRKEAEKAYTKFALLKDAYKKAEKEYLTKLNIFKKLDYELAEIDGRLKRIPPVAERKEKKQPELTLEQLQTIAAKLGVNITVEEATKELIIEEEIKEESDEESEK